MVAYLDHTAKGALPFLRPPVLSQAAGAMAIDAATRESLELTQTANGQRKGSLLDAVDRTVTGAGARALAGDIGAPLMDRDAIEARLDLVQHFHDDAALRERLRAALRALPDIGRAIGRIAAGRGSPRDLGQLRDGLDGAWALSEQLSDGPPLLRETTPRLRGHGELIDLLRRALVPHRRSRRARAAISRRAMTWRSTICAMPEPVAAAPSPHWRPSSARRPASPR